MAVPAQPPQPPQDQTGDDDLYALADTEKTAGARAPMLALAAAPDTASAAGSAIPLGYQRGPTAREIERSSPRILIDPRRDFHVPIVLLVIGAVLYISYYAIHHGLGPMGILATGIGLTVMTVLETVVLIGFAFCIASPLGVSFGGVGTAILKLAAIAVFCDGLTTWVDGFVAKYSGGFGSNIFGYGVAGFPVALGAYWSLLIYLFDMDPGDSWLVVVILSIFYRILRIVLLILLLKLILSLGGVAGSAVALPSVGSGAQQAAANPLVEEIEQAKEQNLLYEARKYVKDTLRRAEAPTIQQWYDAGCKNVWYEMARDVTGKPMPIRIVLELPTDKSARPKCYEVTKGWYEQFNIYYDPASLNDTGEPYVVVGLPWARR